ncbi:Zdhhc15 [Symbiodinium natans]|uniref:Palmitoyltransferase n=1 Tax=Symbiodinium natans TaxID=878477 RepID=A0A812NMK6_9DINO|nr:Zdhhc15 [Symbiodinium natans]
MAPNGSSKTLDGYGLLQAWRRDCHSLTRWSNSLPDEAMDLHSPQALASLSLSFAQYAKHSAAHSKKSKREPPRRHVRKAHSTCDRLLARLLVFLTLSFITLQAHGFYWLALPWFKLSKWPNVAAEGAFGVLVVSLLSLFACTSLLDPGSPTGGDKSADWCDRCKAQKPERCHHCSVCDRCILKMDHHCIFTNSCVGFRNQPYFLSFVALAMFASGFAALAVVPQVPGALLAAFDPARSLFAQLYVILLAASACASFALLWDLLLAQLHGLLRNETTIESMRNWAERRSSPYDRGVMENIVEVFGPRASGLPRCIVRCMDSVDQFLTSAE